MDREYGARGLVGVGTPQSNPTVEPEMRALIPAGVNLLTTRLTSPIEDSRARLIDYIERLPDALATFDQLPLDAFGFACTGSSYLVGVEREEEIVTAAEVTHDYEIITAALAIEQALTHLGARRIAIVAPYPEWLAEAGVAYWDAHGVEVAGAVRVDTGVADTRGVYGIGSDRVLVAASELDSSGADAILLAGTGMPTLAALAEIERASGLPVVSSNLCLAWALAAAIGLEEAAAPPRPPGTGETLITGWRERRMG